MSVQGGHRGRQGPHLRAVYGALQLLQLIVLPAHGVLLQLQEPPIVQLSRAHRLPGWR